MKLAFCSICTLVFALADWSCCFEIVDNDAWAGLECISTTATVEPVAGFTTTQGRKVMLDDYTPVVMHQSSEPDIELELDIRPEDEDF